MNNINYSNFEAHLDYRLKNATKKHKSGQFEAARVDYEVIYQNSPLNYKILNLIGETYFEEKKFQESKYYFQKSLKIEKDFFLASLNMAHCFLKLNEFQNALKFFEQCIRNQPHNTNLHSDIAFTYKKLKMFKMSLEHYNISISLNPSIAGLYNNRGNVYFELKQYEEAIIDYKKAIEIIPNYYECLSNLGSALFKLNKTSEAKNYITQSLSINKLYPESYMNMGMLKIAENKINQGIKYIDKAISIDDKNNQYKMNKSMALLLKGEFVKGWELYETRLKLPYNINFAPTCEEKRWNGKTNLKNKTILLFCEQGLGDTIQFIRYINLLIEFKANVIIQVQKTLVNFFNQLNAQVKIITKDEDVYFDFFYPLLSLPYIFNTNLKNIPNKFGYLNADKEKISLLKKDIKSDKKRIGLVFSGNNNHANTLNRDIRFNEFSKLISNDYKFICLQKDVNDYDLIDLKLNSNIEWPIDYISEDFSNTAALASTLDLVISVDTSIAHLCGSMGINTWLLIPINNDWRWMKNKSTTPWYSSIKIFRQSKIGIWDDVIESINKKLTLL